MISSDISKKIKLTETARAQSRRTGVAPVSNFAMSLVAASVATARRDPQRAEETREFGDRRDACPTTAASPQPAAQFSGIPSAVPDGADNYFRGFAFDNELDGIRPRLWQIGFARQSAGETKSLRIIANYLEEGLQLAGKSLPHPRLARSVEIDRLRKLQCRLFFDDNPKTHRLARNRFSMSATTSSKGRQRSGWASARSARRSNSAACSGVSGSSKSPYSSMTLSATSCCSAGGNRRICSSISAALTPPIYPRPTGRQAAFPRATSRCASGHPPPATRPAHSAFRTPHSAIP